MKKAEKPSLVSITKQGDGFVHHIRYRELRVLAGSTPYTASWWAYASTVNMRLPVSCSDFKSFLDNPQKFLPEKVPCLNNPDHNPCWHTGWERKFNPDHVHQEVFPMFRGYCKECRETISFWPEFILPYQPEPVETHESAVIDHLAGKSFVEIAGEIAYNPRTIARWVRRIIAQDLWLGPKIIALILKELAHSLLPILPTGLCLLVQITLAWLREFAKWVGFPRVNRLIGLANLLGQGQWDLWGGELGNAKPRPTG